MYYPERGIVGDWGCMGTDQRPVVVPPKVSFNVLPIRLWEQDMSEDRSKYPTHPSPFRFRRVPVTALVHVA